MTSYFYRAVNHRGKRVTGILAANGDDDLRRKLRDFGLYCLKFEKSTDSAWWRAVFRVSGLPMSELFALFSHIYKTEDAGIPLIQALQDFRDLASSRSVHGVLSDICEHVSSGLPLSSAISRSARRVPQLVISLVVIGEKSGRLRDVMKYLADNIKWEIQIKRQLMRISIYPTLMVMTVFFALYVMTVTVIPAIEDFLVSQDAELPIYSTALISFARFFVKYWYFGALLKVFLLICGFLYTGRSKFTGALLSNLVIRLPYVGGLVRKLELSKFCKVVLIGFGGGLTVQEAMSVGIGAVSNLVIKEQLSSVIGYIEQGKGIGVSFRVVGAFPVFVLRTIDLGEKSGDLMSAIKSISEFYESEVRDSVELLISLLRPTVVIILGFLLAWLVMAVFGPLYSQVTMSDMFY